MKEIRLLSLQAQRAWQAIMRTGGSSSADRAMPKMMPRLFSTSSYSQSACLSTVLSPGEDAPKFDSGPAQIPTAARVGELTL